MNRLRVLRVIARMNVGGPALQVTTLTEHLDPARFESRLLVGEVDPEEADYLELRAPDVPVVRIPGLGRAPAPFDDLRALARVRREVREFRPHIVHTHTAKAGAIGRLAARSAGVPVVVHTFHGHLLHGYFSPNVTRAVIGVERGLARLTTRFLAVGRQVRDELVEAGIGRASQYDVVPPGVHFLTVPSKREARLRLGVPEASPIVAFVGRLTRVKRPDRLAAVLRQLLAKHGDMIMLVAGEGDLLTQLKVDLGGLTAVRFLGWRADVETIYAAADLVLLTSDNEGMPVSLIEAALCGCPAVATDVGSVTEVVRDGETGRVVGRSADELAAAASALLSDPGSLARMSAQATAWSRREFSRQRLVNDVEEIYLRLAQSKAAGS